MSSYVKDHGDQFAPVYALKWEKVDTGITRTAVFGGWLVMVTDSVSTISKEPYAPQKLEKGIDWHRSVTFVPDVNHEWKI